MSPKNHSQNRFFVSRTNSEPSFPGKWLTIIVIFEMLMIGLSVWLVGYTELRVREGMKRQIRLERLHGDIVHLDEVLTMSAKMASASGSSTWEKRYLQYEPQLDAKIQEVIREAKVLNIDLLDLGISTTNDANSRLVSIEKQSFDHVRENNAQKAYSLLTSAEYKKNKKLYAAGLQKLLTRLDHLASSLVDVQKKQIQAAQFFGILGWMLLLIVWIVVFYSIKKWRTTLLQTQQELSSYQTQLEAKVFSMAKELTRVEHRERQRIASLLHDELQQLLVAARLQLSLIPPVDHKEDINQLLVKSIKVSRSLTNELNPPGLMIGGFDDAIKWLLGWVKNKHELDTTLFITGTVPDLDQEIKVIAFDGIREILFNIVKHSKVQAATVKIDSSRVQQLKITIADKGIGFNPNAVWSGERFGLLNTIRRLELIGGSFNLKTNPNQGCEVVISVPCISQSKENESQEIRLLPQKHQLKVLIVDDHPIVRAGLVSALQKGSTMILREASGLSEVIDTLVTFQPDVAILDISLGKGQPDGEEVALLLKSRLKQIKLIAFTSYEDPRNRERMQLAGVSHYLVKGCATADVINAIRH